jgi:hypothetical protein
MLVWYAVVHLTAMSSACANPIMYGFLNENFKQVNRGKHTLIIFHELRLYHSVKYGL